MRVTQLLSPTIVVVLAACGDGAPTSDAPADAAPNAADFAGTWVITSQTSPTLGTLVRDGSPAGIRGDATFVVTGETSGVLDIRQMLTQDGMMASELKTDAVPVAIEWRRFVIFGPGGVSVFTTELSGDHLVLALDPADPRNTAPEPPSNIVLDRIEPWTTTLVGSWALVSIQLPTGTIVADTCIDLGSSTWATVHMAIDITGRLAFEREATTTSYADPACILVMDIRSSTQRGMAEDVRGALRIWGIENAASEYQAFSYAMAGDTATLTRTACLPMPGCDATAPLSLTMVRR